MTNNFSKFCYESGLNSLIYLRDFANSYKRKSVTYTDWYNRHTPQFSDEKFVIRVSIEYMNLSRYRAFREIYIYKNLKTYCLLVANSPMPPLRVQILQK